MTDESHRATVIIGDTKVIFEGPRDFVEAQVSKYAQPLANTQANLGTNASGGPDARPVSEKQLIEQKQPKGHPEIVAVLAFSLAQSGKKEFTEEDIKRAYLRADVRPPKVVGQAIRDAKNVADYVEPTGARGVYRLTTHGERTVRFDLPRKTKA
ncbi:MAG TPA: hypothetical protein VK828_03490 [Terriglobales bacterium]|nr:hypothetical protein [Terriglobales bacterium]